ncbi:hypothetical protein ACAW68_08560 [Weissella confusa]|uniref:hypothetical protein n=1 Tax=Weissella confusa TaxID=1583 RepID=UPI0035A295E5
MKMNKIVLASLLSVSLLGASTSVFADSTNDVTTTNFTVEKGTLAFAKDPEDGTKNAITHDLTFKSASVADLLSTDYTDSKPFSASVTDTTGNPDQGWTLTANYTPLKNVTGTKTSYLGETLTIGDKDLTANKGSNVVYSVDGAEDVKAFANPDLKGTITKNDDATLKIKAGTGAVAGTYSGKIDWVLEAAPAN